MGKTSTTPTTAVTYIRVSSQKQHASGLGEDAQRAAVESYARTNGLRIVNEYREVETGTRKRSRPVLAQALADARDTGSVLLIAKLDRLARNVRFISTLMEGQVPFVAVDLPQVTPLTLHILAAVAEEEARMISARTKAALAAAKARGVVMGKPENLTHDAQMAGGAANRETARTSYRTLAGYIAMMRESGMTLRAIAAQLNGEGSRTRRGSLFTAATVQRILDRQHTTTAPARIQRQATNHTTR